MLNASLPSRRSCRLAAMAVAAAVSTTLPATAQLIEGVYPADVPGFGGAPGVSVTSRVHDDTDWQSIRLGSALLHPELTQSFGYDSAVLAGQRGSATLDTSGTLSLSDFAGDQGYVANLSLNHQQLTGDPSQSQTDWTAAVGSAIPLSFGQMTVAVAHLSLHETDTDLDAAAFAEPLPFTVDTLRLGGALPAGRFDLTPSFDVTRYAFGSTSIDGIAAPQSFRDRNVYEAGLTASTGLTSVGDPDRALLILRGTDTSYTDPTAGPGGTAEPSRDSTGGSVLVGTAHDLDGIWGWRVAVGAGGRSFSSSAYNSRIAPLAEAALTWQPTERTTWHAALIRRIEDASDEGEGSYVATIAGVAADHEVKRNLILHAGIDFENANYSGGTTQTITTGRLSLLWLVDRNVRMSAKVELSDHAGGVGGTYGEDVVLLGMTVGI
jgi:hypothetical protein